MTIDSFLKEGIILGNYNKAELKSHGMGKELVEPDWRKITLEEAEGILKYYPKIRNIKQLTWHSPRPFSSAAIALTDSGYYFLKRHHFAIRDVEAILEEHRFIEHLRNNGLPVSNVVKGESDKTAFTLDEWTYEIHLLGEGDDWYRDAVSWSPFKCKEDAYAAGKALAQMHIAAETFEAPKRKQSPLISSFSIFNSAHPIKQIEEYLKTRPALVKYLDDKRWKDDIQKHILAFHEQLYVDLQKLKPIWTHNDWHASNLLWANVNGKATVKTILDFGLSDKTYAVYDLATAIERNIIEWLELGGKLDCTVHYGALDALLAGYEFVRPLSKLESHVLYKILPLVHVEFALSEIDYFYGIIKSEENADLAYNTFLIGHVKWFGEPSGQQLLNYLKQRVNA